MINIIIADDHTLFINGLQLLLKDEPDIHILDVANDGKELMDRVAAQQPDIILLDINMPKLNGLEAAKYIKQKYPGIKTIIISTYSEQHLVEKARLTGVNGYLLKTSNREELVQTIRMINNNQTCFPYTEPREKNQFSEVDKFLKQFNLTNRETQIIQLIKNGLTNQQIAEQLFLSIYTVETHRKNIMQKLNLNSPTALMKFLMENQV